MTATGAFTNPLSKGVAGERHRQAAPAAAGARQLASGEAENGAIARPPGVDGGAPLGGRLGNVEADLFEAVLAERLDREHVAGVENDAARGEADRVGAVGPLLALLMEAVFSAARHQRHLRAELVAKHVEDGSRDERR